MGVAVVGWFSLLFLLRGGGGGGYHCYKVYINENKIQTLN